MKYGYKEVRTMHKDDLRALCIRKEWYTNGTNEDYIPLLESVENKNITTDDIVEIAQNIIDHSNLKLNDETFEMVCFELFDICYTFIKKV